MPTRLRPTSAVPTPGATGRVPSAAVPGSGGGGGDSSRSATVARVQAQIDADPELQGLLAQIRQGTGGGLHNNRQMAQMGQRVASVLAAHGIELPHDYVLSVNDGQLQRHDFWERNPWVAPAIVIGAGGMMAIAAAPGLIGGTTGATSATATGATGGGVGLGETAAVTGLTGSGFGTGGGLGLTSVLGGFGPSGAALLPATVAPMMSNLPGGASQVLDHTPVPTPDASTLDQVKKLLGLTGNDNDLLPVIIRALAGLGAGALAPNFFQPRKSFEGTGADPTAWLTDARSAIGGAYNAAAARANEPTDFSGASVTKPANRSGGGMEFGLTASPDAVNKSLAPKRVPLQFAPMPTTPNLAPRTPANPTGTPGHTNPNLPGTPPPDHAIPRRPPGTSPPAGTSTTQVQPGQQNLEGLFSEPTGVQPQQGESPGRASARLLLSSLIAQQQPQPGQGGQG